ncbi:hypothetical protein CUJ84_Chr002913 [Rhizobium leguminosarum]|uniref:Sel1 repeat family protein n=2 Tax=Rhizobium leguminosarum TaxID=384 RepID=A0A2K9Z584_RHILE|nr:hypothetical protein CUJ84_Chr002913 [Rhizobium leguminosarum]
MPAHRGQLRELEAKLASAVAQKLSSAALTPAPGHPSACVTTDCGRQAHDIALAPPISTRSDVAMSNPDSADLAAARIDAIRQAAEQGDAQAQFELGHITARGEGVTGDKAEGASWIRKAASQGHADAQYLLGLMREDGNGCDIDPTDAVRWYGQAANQDHAGAQYRLAQMKEHGVGCEINLTEAFKWYRRAALQDYPDAREDLLDLCRAHPDLPLPVSELLDGKGRS